MDIDDGAVARRHTHRCDSVRMNTSDPSVGRLPSDPQNHQIVGSIQTSIHSLPSHPPPDRERLPGSDDSPHFMIVSSPTFPVNRLGETSDIYQDPGFAGQPRDVLPSLKPSASEQEVTTRKRKRTHDLPPTLITDHDHPHDDPFTDGAHPQSHRRIRPRLRIQQDMEFSPLLIMSPGRERDSPAEQEETISAFHYTPNVTDPSHSIRRHFYPANHPEHGPRILQSSSSPPLDDLDRQERGRSDSANSFAQVALASTTTRKHGRLSTLQDFWLPRPFEEPKRPSLALSSASANVKVHERGLEAPPSFLSTTGSGRMGGPRASRESAGSPTDALGHPIRAPIREDGTQCHAVSPPRAAMLPLETNMTIGTFFGKPICDSPEEISPGGWAHSL